jgi:hypothetical protein
LAGLVVELEDRGGQVIATTTTDSRGHYEFDNFKGISGTGTYRVSLIVPPGEQQTTANPAPMVISRGSVDVDGVDFGIALSAGGLASSTCNLSSLFSLGDNKDSTASQFHEWGTQFLMGGQ